MSLIMITGAAGFIGSHLSEALIEKGHKVVGVDNFDPFYDESIKRSNLEGLLKSSDFKLIAGDAGKVETLSKINEKVDIVVHLAAKAGVLPSLHSPKTYIRSNIELTNNILEWMKDEKIKKMVFGSSSSVYGNTAKIPFDENDNVNEPISPYAFTKRSCELMNYTYHTLYGMDIINLRFFTVYGERQRPDLAIHKFIRQMMDNQPITIYGDGQTARDYTYYSDIVNGVTAAIDYINEHDDVWETFNLGNHSPVSLKELINEIAEVAGFQPQMIYQPMKPGDVNITYASIEKAKRVLGYHPKINLRQGLNSFIDWYKNQQVKVKV